MESDLKTKRQSLINSISRLEQELRSERVELEHLVTTCRHVWGDAVYKPIYREAYTSPGDPPGTMGVDWRPPVHVPSSTTPRWIRTCKLCGHEEETTRSTDKVTQVPSW